MPVDETTVVRPAEPAPTLRIVPGSVVVATVQREPTFPEYAEPALAALLDGSARCAADLAAVLDPPGRLTLVRRLAREGALAVSR